MLGRDGAEPDAYVARDRALVSEAGVQRLGRRAVDAMRPSPGWEKTESAGETVISGVTGVFSAKARSGR